MSRGPERDPLGRVVHVRAAGVVRRDQPRDVHEQVARRGLPGERMDGHARLSYHADAGRASRQACDRRATAGRRKGAFLTWVAQYGAEETAMRPGIPRGGVRFLPTRSAPITLVVDQHHVAAAEAARRAVPSEPYFASGIFAAYSRAWSSFEQSRM